MTAETLRWENDVKILRRLRRGDDFDDGGEEDGPRRRWGGRGEHPGDGIAMAVGVVWAVEPCGV